MKSKATKRLEYEARQERRLRNVCRECDNDRGVNKDGTQSLFCDTHREAHAGMRKTVTPPVVTRGDIDVLDYRDRPAFKAGTLLVLHTLKRANAPMSIGDLRRAMGETFPERHIYDHLECIDGLYETSTIQPTRWVLDPKRKVNGVIPTRPTFKRPTDRTRPMASSFGAESHLSY